MMLKVRHRRGVPPDGLVVWADAFLVQMLYGSNAFDGAVAVLAYPDSDFGHEEGMKIVIEKNLYNVRIARSRIPLFSTPQGAANFLPDAPNSIPRAPV